MSWENPLSLLAQVLLPTWAAEPFGPRSTADTEPVQTRRRSRQPQRRFTRLLTRRGVFSAARRLPVWGDAKCFPACSVRGGPKAVQLCQQEILRLKLHFCCHGSFRSPRWFYFATLLLADTAQLFYALEKI